MKKFFWLLSLGLLVITAVGGCGTTSSSDTTTTTTVATTTTTTTTTETSTTTTSTTTTTISGHVIQGEIINYGGAASQIYVYVMLGSWEGDPVTTEIVSTSSSPINYSFILDEAGTYYVFAADYNVIEGVVPAVNNWIGGYNWTGTDSVEAAGDIFAAYNAVVAHTLSVEVASVVTANVYMHQIIEPTGEAALSGTITWEWGSLPAEERWGVPAVLLYDDPESDPINFSVGAVIATGEAAEYSFTIQTLTSGTYYLLGACWYMTTEAGGDSFIMGGYSDGLMPGAGGTMEPISYSGTPISGINWQLLIVP